MAKIFVYDSSKVNDGKFTYVLDPDVERKVVSSKYVKASVASNGWVLNFKSTWEGGIEDKLLRTRWTSEVWLRLTEEQADAITAALVECNKRFSSPPKPRTASKTVFSRFGINKTVEPTTTPTPTPAPTFLSRVESPWIAFTISLENWLWNYLQNKSKIFNGITLFCSSEYRSIGARRSSIIVNRVDENDIFYAPYEFVQRLRQAFVMAQNAKKEEEEAAYRATTEFKLKQLGTPVEVLSTSTSTSTSTGTRTSTSTSKEISGEQEGAQEKSKRSSSSSRRDGSIKLEREDSDNRRAKRKRKERKKQTTTLQ